MSWIECGQIWNTVQLKVWEWTTACLEENSRPVLLNVQRDASPFLLIGLFVMLNNNAIQ